MQDNRAPEKHVQARQYSKLTRLVLFLLSLVCIIIGYRYFRLALFQHSQTADPHNQDPWRDKKITSNVSGKLMGMGADFRQEILDWKQKNQDVLAIIEVPGTNIKQPVLQSADNDYYLRRDINRKSSRNGSIYLDYECILSQNPNNLIFYGHNMQNNQMFSQLEKFKQAAFFQQHPEIILYLPNEKRHFEIVSATIIDLTGGKKPFPFNSYIHSGEEMDSALYAQEMAKNALHVRARDIDKNSNLITLSTCTYETEDARLVIVGVEKYKEKVVPQNPPATLPVPPVPNH